MSEISAIRNAVRAEKTLAKAEKAAPRLFDQVIPKKPQNIVKTASGAEVDISRGYNVKGPDGTKIPFLSDTPLEKAKQWTKNFYNPGETEFVGNRLHLKDDENSFIDFQTRADGTMRVTMSKVTQKGTGVGAGLYKKLFDKAAEQGVKVESDRAMSEASVAVWRRFKQLGYPITEYPSKKMMSGGYENADSPMKPLFEFTPTKKEKPPEPAKIPEADDVEKELRTTLKGKSVSGKDRDELTGLYLKYKEADADTKEVLAGQIKEKLAKSAAPVGLVAAGNIDLDKRKPVKNADGSISTELSFSIGTDQGEVLIPQIVDGKKLTKEEAIAHYKKTGEHLGIFDTPEHADAYAQKLHEEQGKKYVDKPMEKMEPGLYYDEDSKQYYHVGDDGKITPAKLDETR